MPALLLSTRSLPAAQSLEEAARDAGWSVHAYDELPSCVPDERIVYYGGADVAMEAAARFHLALLEPPLDLLARLPASLRLREVQYASLRDLRRLQRPAFIKPADPLNKCFDAGTYAGRAEIRVARGIDPATPILVAEPVEWLAEFRCFVRDSDVVASSPYLSFGRPIWHEWGQGGEKAQPSRDALAVCRRLLSAGVRLPPAFVVDVGLIEDRGWAVVEFNPAWCSGLLGAAPRPVLDVLACACRDARDPGSADSPWVTDRSRPQTKDRASDRA